MVVLFCVVPHDRLDRDADCHEGLHLTGKRMKEIQEVNAKRRDAIAEGMSLEEAMEKYK